MMREIKSIAGLRVISLDEGANVGTINQVVVDLAEGTVLGVIIGSGASEKGVLVADIQTIGTDVVMISTRDVARHLTDLPELNQHKRAAGAPLLQVFTQAGKRLGAVSAIYIDPFEKVVTRYEISGGAYKDVTEGVLILPVTPGTVHGEDAIILPDDAVRQHGREVGGLFNRFSQLSEKVRTQYEQAAEGAGKLVEEGTQTLRKEAEVVRQKAGELTEKAKDALAPVVAPEAPATEAPAAEEPVSESEAAAETAEPADEQPKE
jgi:uncharacterized protein YrrD